MKKMNKLLFLLLCLLLVSCKSMVQDVSKTGPELVVLNAQVLTVDTRYPRAEAFAVQAGKFTQVGTNNEIKQLIRDNTKVIDAQNKTIIPGLNDGHIHMVRAGMYWPYEVRLDEATNLADILQLIRERAKNIPKGTWILTLGGWHPSQIKEGRMPTLAELNQAAPDHPVYIQALREVGQMNSQAIQKSGITATTPMPAGVSIGKDTNGHFNGLIKGFNGQVLALRQFPKLSLDEKIAGLVLAMKDFNQAGLTSVGETFGIGVDEGDYDILFEAWRRKQMSVRVGLHFPTVNYKDAQKWIANSIKGKSDDMLLLNGLGEGVLNSVGDGYFPKQFPISNDAKEELRQIVALGVPDKINFQFHATLETTMNDMLDSLEAVDQKTSIKDMRITFLHAEQITPAIMARMKKLGMGLQMQNRQSLGSDLMKTNWGDRAMDSPPVKSVYQSGIPLAGGTDGTTSSSYRPFISLHWLISGKNWRGDVVRPTQKLTREEALKIYTHGGAWFTWEENKKGTIAKDMLADFVILDKDYLTIPEDEIRFIKPLMTVVGGRVVYESKTP